MMTYFDSCKIPVIAHGLDLMQAGVIKDKSYLEFAKDIYASVLRQYAHYDEHQCYKINDYGSYFPAVIQNPDFYIQR